jgi:hypothetical protein
VIALFISHHIFTLRVSSRGIGVLNQRLNILGGSKIGSRVWFDGRKGGPSEYFGGRLTGEKGCGMDFNCIVLVNGC